MGQKVKEWTVLSMLEWATDYFEEKNIPDPRHSIEWLLAEILNIKRLDLYLKFDRPLSPAELDELRPLVKRRADHEPLQYIIGYSDFMNARISVNPDVLIPRIETEQLVEIILEDHQEKQKELSVLDIGTGSGCIPIALKIERPSWQVSGIDISEDALDTARQNAAQNDAEINFQKGDILSPESIASPSQLHIIVSNPPYITPEEKETLEPQVRNYEPRGALFTEDMNKLYGQIIQFSQEHLSPKGVLYLELHERYAQQIQQLFDQSTWRTTLQKDYDQKERFLIARPT
ncbi:peptide chain release factor N(5)-glutamine methyltransferase [Fodinibius salsisoli]|uniref:Release factor glutamine methyltransferase n=1 Tax=Fodinibius salsisoli TaxID=2820877 RepID=A0ABT3PNN8_9BACT|nr:peptide chain release factor N(5)-glutamine methyltransferase [Fodinibius salsisoli]MCW9707464.1 peptide chain release factor N(5)-glutamine methyltransferase [Fodinibius salsisoli]